MRKLIVRPLDKGGTGDLSFGAVFDKSPARFARRPLCQGGRFDAAFNLKLMALGQDPLPVKFAKVLTHLKLPSLNHHLLT